MYRARRTFLVAQVWLTALLTLASNVPQLTCVCPDGRVKLFCLSILPGLAGCCCSESHACCCGTPTADPGVKPCCRASHGAGKPHSSSQLGSAGCRKTLTPPAIAAVSSPSADARPAGDLPAAAYDFAVASCVTPAPFTSDHLRIQHHPPDDLTVTLQRLVI